MLECRGVGYNVGSDEGERWLLRDVSLEMRAGEFLAVIGPNGAGKSTLLKCLAGTLLPSEGEVRISGNPVRSFTPGKLALQRAVLTQRRPEPLGAVTGYELAEYGRYPHRRTSRRSQDRLIVEDCLRRTESAAFASRNVQTLSGGEASRIDFARVLAQESPVVLLDEPTNHLDPRHQMEAVTLCRDMARAGSAVVAALHDLNLAALLADRILVLTGGRTAAAGPPCEVLTQSLLEDIYQIPFELCRRSCGRMAVLPLSPPESQALPRAANNAPVDDGLSPTKYSDASARTESSASRFEPAARV